MKIALWAAALMLAGCSAKAPVVDDFSDLAGLDEKSDRFTARFRLEGALAYGATPTVDVSSYPRYRAFKFAGQRGQTYEIHVSSRTGDPVSWLLNDRFSIVAKNDDVDDGTTDSHISIELYRSGTYYIVFRDYYWQSHRFTVALDVAGLTDAVPEWLPDAAIRQFEELLYDPEGTGMHHFDEIRAADLPEGARAQLEANVREHGAEHTKAYRYEVEEAAVFVVRSLVPEWTHTVDLFDWRGRFLAHGFGDGEGGGLDGWNTDR